jgi:hypothetical protein
VYRGYVSKEDTLIVNENALSIRFQINRISDSRIYVFFVRKCTAERGGSREGIQKVEGEEVLAEAQSSRSMSSGGWIGFSPRRSESPKTMHRLWVSIVISKKSGRQAPRALRLRESLLHLHGPLCALRDLFVNLLFNVSRIAL